MGRSRKHSHRAGGGREEGVQRYDEPSVVTKTVYIELNWLDWKLKQMEQEY